MHSQVCAKDTTVLSENARGTATRHMPHCHTFDADFGRAVFGGARAHCAASMSGSQ